MIDEIREMLLADFNAVHFNARGALLYDVYDEVGHCLGKVVSSDDEALYEAIEAYPAAVRVVHRGDCYPCDSVKGRRLVQCVQAHQRPGHAMQARAQPVDVILGHALHQLGL